MTNLIIHNEIKLQQEYLIRMVNELLDTSYTQLSQFINNPDIHMINLPEHISIKLEDIKSLQKGLLFKPYQSRYQIGIIVHAENMTIEAQNSMLKTLEEATQYTRFFILTTNERNLLPTIVSRSIKHYVARSAAKIVDNIISAVIGVGDSEDINDSRIVDPPKILSQSIVEQFKEIESLVENDKENKGVIISFLNELQAYFHSLLSESIEHNRYSDMNEINAKLELISTAFEQYHSNTNKRLLLENLLLQLKDE